MRGASTTISSATDGASPGDEPIQHEEPNAEHDEVQQRLSSSQDRASGRVPDRRRVRALLRGSSRTSGGSGHAEALRVVRSPARRRDLDARARSRTRAARDRSSDPSRRVISSGAPIVFVQVAFATSTVLPTGGQLAVRADACGRRTRRRRRSSRAAVALRVEPALDDLDAVEVARRSDPCSAATRKVGALPCRRGAQVATHRHALAIADLAGIAVVRVGARRSPSRRRSARPCAGRWSRRSRGAPSHRTAPRACSRSPTRRRSRRRLRLPAHDLTAVAGC